MSIPESNISSCVTLVWLLDLVELKVEGRVLGQVSGPGQLLDQRQELVVIATVVVQLNLKTVENVIHRLPVVTTTTEYNLKSSHDLGFTKFGKMKQKKENQFLVC
jgi:hypothetical protein